MFRTRYRVVTTHLAPPPAPAPSALRLPRESVLDTINRLEDERNQLWAKPQRAQADLARIADISAALPGLWVEERTRRAELIWGRVDRTLHA